MEASRYWLLTSLVLTTGNNKASKAPFNMWTCSLETYKQKHKAKTPAHLETERSNPTMTLLSWHWYEPVQSQRKRWGRWRLGESSLKLLETTAPHLLSWSSPNGAVDFEKSVDRQFKSLAPEVINPVSQTTSLSEAVLNSGWEVPEGFFR